MGGRRAVLAGVGGSVAKAAAAGVSLAMVLVALSGAVAPAGAAPVAAATTAAPTWDAQLLPALPGSTSTGPRWTPLAGVVVPLRSMGVLSSTVPSLQVDQLDVPAVKFVVRTVASGVVRQSDSVLVNTSGVASWTVPIGWLAPRQDYRVSVVNAANTSVVVVAERVLAVDVQRAGQQQLWPSGGLSVSQVTGEPVAQWTSPGLSTLEGTAGFSLMFRPSSEAQKGLPSGWELLPQGVDSGWKSLTVSLGGQRAKLIGWNGWEVTFEKSGAGAFTADLGPHQSWPGGRITTLAADADGAWTATDSSQTVTTFPAHATTSTFTVWPSKVWTYGMPSLQQSWAAGALDHITDPVSGRRIQFHYAPSDDCVAPASGFIAVPTGSLCSSTSWDGQKTAVSYVCVVATSPCPAASAQIGRITAYAGTGSTAQVTDLAWDRSARIVGLRQPLAAAAIAAGVVTPGGTALPASDVRAQTTVTYDSSGRVHTITTPAGLVSGNTQTTAQTTRAIQTYSYSTLAAAAPLPALGVFTVKQSPTPGNAIPVTVSAAELTTMDQRWSKGPLGTKVTATWNVQDEANEVFDEATRMRSKTVYNPLGEPVKAFGPSKLAMTETSGATETKTQYDTYDANPRADVVDMQPIKGLVLFSWDNVRTSGVPSHRSIGPLVGGSLPTSLGFTLASNPSGNGGTWSGRMTGRYIAKTAGTYSFRTLTGAHVWANGKACTQTVPCDVSLAAGASANLQVDMVSASTGTVALNIQVLAPGGSWVSVPMTDVRPGLGQVTRVDTPDQRTSGGAASSFYTMTRYDYAAGTGNPVAETSASGNTISFAWRPATGTSGQWGQMASATGPSGHTTTFSYYAPQQTATNCDSQAVDQGGQRSGTTLPGGSTTQQQYNTTGSLTEASASGAKACLTYRPDGSLASGSATGDGLTTYSVATNPAVGDNPLVSSRSTTIGLVTTVATSEISITGLLFRTTDSNGTVTTNAYDPSSRALTSVTETTAQSQTRTFTLGYDVYGQHTTTTLTGTGIGSALVLETISYLKGEVSKVTYANATTSETTRDNNGNLNKVTYAGFELAKSVSELDTFSRANAILTRTLTDANGATVNFAGTYDLDHRLTTSTVTGTIPVTTKSTTLDLSGTAGASGNRQSETTVNAADVSTTSAFTYDSADKLTSSTKPGLTSTISYDGQGRTTAIGDSTLSYDAAGNLATANGARGSLSFAANGDTVFTPTGGSAITLRLSGDMLLDSGNNLVGQVIDLENGVTVALNASGTPVAWRYDDLQGSPTWSTTGSTSSPAPSSTTVYDPWGTRISTTTPATPTTPLELALSMRGWKGTNALPIGDDFVVMGARQYSPAAGRFLQRDPVVNGSWNPYEFAGSDPWNSSDPSGNLSKGKWAGLGASIGIAILAIIIAIIFPPASILEAVVAGAVVGAVSAFAASTIEQTIDNQGKIDWTKVGLAVAMGAGIGAAVAGLAQAGPQLLGRLLISIARSTPAANGLSGTVSRSVMSAAKALNRAAKALSAFRSSARSALGLGKLSSGVKAFSGSKLVDYGSRTAMSSLDDAAAAAGSSAGNSMINGASDLAVDAGHLASVLG